MRDLKHVFIIVTASLFIFISCASGRQDVKKYNEGLALMKQKKYEAALQKYEEALVINPKLFIAANNAGATCFNMGDMNCALKYFSLAVNIRPDYPNAWYNIAVIHYKENRFVSALSSILRSSGDDAIDLAVIIFLKLEKEGLLFEKAPDFTSPVGSMPKFPEDIENGWVDWVEGRVEYLITADENGLITDRNIIYSSADPFKDEAEKIFLNSKFHPGLDKNGKAIPSITSITYQFYPERIVMKKSGNDHYTQLFLNIFRMKKLDLYEKCYLHEFEKDRKLEGLVNLSMFVTPEGKIVEIVAEGDKKLKNEKVLNCIKDNVKKIKLPPFSTVPVEEGRDIRKKYFYTYWFGYIEEE
ncbi:MAG TPA: tetratricopeptide repeat protein [bacterium]|nr:tetratricopeptide repeat protein [bacterium]